MLDGAFGNIEVLDYFTIGVTRNHGGNNFELARFQSKFLLPRFGGLECVQTLGPIRHTLPSYPVLSCHDRLNRPEQCPPSRELVDDSASAKLQCLHDLAFPNYYG